MNKKDLYPKAIAVYNAVLSLLKEGSDVTKLTVSDIAKAAGIGKGTTYEYFSSKDEIIAKSLIYGYKLMMGYIVEKLKNADKLWDKISVLYETSVEFEFVRVMGNQVFNAVSTSEEMQQKIIELFEEEKKSENIYEVIAKQLTDCAVREGFLSADADKDYVFYVSMAMFQLIFSPIGCMMHNRISMDAQKKHLYHMYINSLKQ